MILIAVLALSQAATSCATCHAPEQASEASGCHIRAAACVACHGGNPKETDKERSHAGFSGKIDRRKVPALCATCHSDPRTMNPYGLPTDPHAQYLTSKHGEALAKGNLQAAVCIDCHGVHGIRRARDPESPVYPSRVPSTCGRCHGNRELMGKLGHSWDAEALYRESVHGELLLKKGDLAAPHCATCHGNHGAAPPGFADVGRVCGKCHVNQLAAFEASPHAFYAKDGSFKACVACHANHRIVSTPREIAGRCQPCHEAPDKEMKKFAVLSGFLDGARADFAAAKDRLARAARAGLPTDDEEPALDRARTSLLLLSPLQHSLNEPKVAALAKTAGAQAADVMARLDRKEKAERTKKLALVPIWGFLAGLAWVFRAKGRRIERPPGGTP